MSKTIPEEFEMLVHTSEGFEVRPLECLRVDRNPFEQLQPVLRDGEFAVHTIGGECHVIYTGR